VIEVTFKESLNKMEAMDLEDNPEAMEVTEEWQELRNEKINMYNIKSMDDQYDDQH
jgi:hypothetical protein